eukprot:SAG31_NODE_20992_length_560_cov_0.863341_1_plen_41_part_01
MPGAPLLLAAPLVLVWATNAAAAPRRTYLALDTRNLQDSGG